MTDISRREALVIICGATAVPAVPGARDARRSTMLTKPIPSSREALPVIGMGTWQTFDTGSPTRELEQVLATFVELGGHLVDSSPMYGSAERVVGDIAAKLSLRDRLFVATKVWTSGRREGIEQMEESERKLRARPIDLMQVHNLVDADTHLATLDAWKKEGRIRYTGITHYTASALDSVAKIIARRAVDFVQINYSVAEREAEERLLPLAADRGVAVIANRPFASGDLFRRLRATPLPAWAAEIDCTSWAQVLLKFVVSHPAITCAIPATSKVAHLRDNMSAGIGRMPDTAMRKKIAASV